ncbi:O-antigen ligase family protein [Spirosoma flavum]|uniref:O-antigen ligase family protein n=1 Tax=Spirosoma flavum TaxID=2048557 RepID=A0ABW6AQA7_9BACT
MIIASIFLLSISAVSWFKKPYVTICLILFLLPHQFILKKVFDNQFNSGDLFSIWKETLIIILLIKTYKEKELSIVKIQSLIVAFVILAVLFYVITDNHITSLANLRNYTFPILAFVIIATYKFDVGSKYIIRSIIYSSLIAICLGFVQQYLLNIPIATYKGTIDFIDDSGYIKYTTNSFRIMGIERMSGGFAGPNDFGVYFSLIVVFSVVLLSSTQRNLGSRLFNVITILNLIGSLACLILSFSRAGWFILLASLLVIFLIQIKSKIKTTFIVLVTILVTLALALAFIPETVIKASEVLTGSISMKEASAADRGNQFWKGVEKTITEPLGHGVGTSDIRYAESLGFFVESAWWNIGYELGLMGLILFLYINLQILLRIIHFRWYSRRYKVLFSFDSYAIALMVATIIAGFISINVVGTTYIYYFWIFIGLAFKTLNKSNAHPIFVNNNKNVNLLPDEIYDYHSEVNA